MSLPIDYHPRHSCMLERGWVLAFAHVRGGGERGKAWHAAGRGLKKWNSFWDFEVRKASRGRSTAAAPCSALNVGKCCSITSLHQGGYDIISAYCPRRVLAKSVRKQCVKSSKPFQVPTPEVATEGLRHYRVGRWRDAPSITEPACTKTFDLVKPAIQLRVKGVSGAQSDKSVLPCHPPCRLSTRTNRTPGASTPRAGEKRLTKIFIFVHVSSISLAYE